LIQIKPFNFKIDNGKDLKIFVNNNILYSDKSPNGQTLTKENWEIDIFYQLDEV